MYRLLNKKEKGLILRALEIYYNNNKVAAQRDEINNVNILLRNATTLEISTNVYIEKEPIDSSNQIRSSHYGGADNPYEAIKVIDAWKANFNLGNAIKYICRVCIGLTMGQGDGKQARKKHIEDLKKVKTYLDFEIEKLEKIK